MFQDRCITHNFKIVAKLWFAIKIAEKAENFFDNSLHVQR